METSPLAVESFSYSWLRNVKPSFDGRGSPLRTSLDSCDEATSKEKDYNILKSQRLMDENQNFKFDVPSSQSSVALIHADEVFSNGFIMPMFINPPKKEVLDTSDSISSAPVSPFFSRASIPAVGIRCSFLRKWQKSSKSALHKCFGFFRPLCRKIGGSRESIRVDDIDRRLWEAKSWKGSPQQSVQRSASYSAGDWCHTESSIHEAVLYCKRTFGK